MLNSPAIIITTGSAGGVGPVNQAGGSHTYSSRWAKPLAVSGIDTGTTRPGSVGATVPRSAASPALGTVFGNGAALTWAHASSVVVT